MLFTIELKKNPNTDCFLCNVISPRPTVKSGINIVVVQDRRSLSILHFLGRGLHNYQQPEKGTTKLAIIVHTISFSFDNLSEHRKTTLISARPRNPLHCIGLG